VFKHNPKLAQSPEVLCNTKAVYRERAQAELDADYMVNQAWLDGIDKTLWVFLCLECGFYHIGTRAERRRNPGKKRLHTFYDSMRETKL
jgi:hypothetical protein